MSVSAMAVLKSETSAAHLAVERCFSLEYLTSSVSNYERMLWQLLGFHEPVESQLRQTQLRLPFSLWPRVDDLKADLLFLKGLHLPSTLSRVRTSSKPSPHDVQSLPCSPLQRGEPPPRLPVDQEAGWLGVTYVIEGSSLGGRMIARQVQERLGISPETGGRFFAGPGVETGDRWNRFRSLVDARLTTELQRRAAVDAAHATFQAMEIWLSR